MTREKKSFYWTEDRKQRDLHRSIFLSIDAKSNAINLVIGRLSLDALIPTMCYNHFGESFIIAA